MNPEIAITILQFIVLILPIAGLVWHASAMRAALKADITENAHRLDLIEAHFEDLNDRYVLAFNGLREKVEHIRERSANEERRQSERLTDVESFLEKTTNFNRRR